MSFILIRGGGDLASGVALRLHQSGFPVMISELPMPLALRRRAAFAAAIYAGNFEIQNCQAYRVDDPEDLLLINRILSDGAIPVLVDPEGEAIRLLRPKVVVDGRMLKRHLIGRPGYVRFLIGLGPGFVAGENCDAVVETNHGSSLGHLVWQGPAEPNTSMPEEIQGHSEARILRAPVDGIVETCASIGDHVAAGQTMAQIGSHFICASFSGVLRGLIHSGLAVKRGTRIGDLDPRDDARVCDQVSDKSLAVAQGVLEAIFSKFNLLDFKHKSVA